MTGETFNIAEGYTFTAEAGTDNTRFAMTTQPAGKVTAIKATTNTGYKFLYWQKNDEAGAYNSNAQFNYTVMSGDVTFTAVYEKLKVITVAKNVDAEAGRGGEVLRNKQRRLVLNPCRQMLAEAAR